MQGLTAGQLLDLAEAGHRQSWTGRGVLLLECAWPEATYEERLALACGERDRALIGLRMATFGRQVPVYTACPGCGEQLEAEFDLSALVEAGPSESAVVARAGERVLPVRPLTSADFLAVEGLSPAEAARELVRRTLTAGDEPPPEVDEVDDDLRAEVAKAVAVADPLAEIKLGFACHACRRAWSETLDIVDLFWKEIESAARRVAWQVHTLAQAYGWTETTILGLTMARRNLYLSMLAHG